MTGLSDSIGVLQRRLKDTLDSLTPELFVSVDGAYIVHIDLDDLALFPSAVAALDELLNANTVGTTEAAEGTLATKFASLLGG